MDKKILLVGVLCLTTFFAFGTEVDSTAFVELKAKVDSLTKTVNEISDWKKDILWKLSLIGLSFGGVSLIGLYFFWTKMIKKAEKIAVQKIETQTDEIVEKSLIDKLGGKLALAKAFFEDFDKKKEIKNNPILIVSATAGRNKNLAQFLEDEGYTNLKFKSIDELNATDSSISKVVFFYNKDANLSENKIQEVMKAYHNNFDAFVYFGVHLKNDIRRQYANVTLATNQSAIPTNLFDALNSKRVRL